MLNSFSRFYSRHLFKVLTFKKIITFFVKNAENMAYTNYKTTNSNDFFFCYAVQNSVQFATTGLAIWL